RFVSHPLQQIGDCVGADVTDRVRCLRHLWRAGAYQHNSSVHDFCGFCNLNWSITAVRQRENPVTEGVATVCWPAASDVADEDRGQRHSEDEGDNLGAFPHWTNMHLAPSTLNLQPAA